MTDFSGNSGGSISLGINNVTPEKQKPDPGPIITDPTEWQRIYLAEAQAHAKALSDSENRALLWKCLSMLLGAFLLIVLLDSHGCWSPKYSEGGNAPMVEP